MTSKELAQRTAVVSSAYWSNLVLFNSNTFIIVVFANEIKRHKVRNHNATAMLFNQQQPLHVVPSTPQSLNFGELKSPKFQELLTLSKLFSVFPICNFFAEIATFIHFLRSCISSEQILSILAEWKIPTLRNMLFCVVIFAVLKS